MTAVGILTIGQAPRADGLGAEVQQVLGERYRVVERGALDGLTGKQVATMEPAPGEYRLVTLLADGTPVQIGKPAVLALLQRQIERLEVDDQVAATLLLCTGAFPPFRHDRLLLQPQAALYGTVSGLAAGDRVAAMLPLESQRTQHAGKWAGVGIDPLLVVADPYGPEPERAVAAAAAEAGEAGAKVLFLDCFGYSLAMGEAARHAFAGPVVVARSLAARLLMELVPAVTAQVAGLVAS